MGGVGGGGQDAGLRERMGINLGGSGQKAYKDPLGMEGERGGGGGVVLRKGTERNHRDPLVLT